MEINDKTYILGYWFASDGTNDWYLIMTKQDDQWIGKHTFRYASGNPDPFSGEDRKSIYEIKIPGEETENAIIDKIDFLHKFITKKYNQFNDKFLVKGGLDEFMEIAKTKDYLHMKEVPNGR